MNKITKQCKFKVGDRVSMPLSFSVEEYIHGTITELEFFESFQKWKARILLDDGTETDRFTWALIKENKKDEGNQCAQ